MRKASNECIQMIKEFEGFRSKAYKVPGLDEYYYTIGYGHYGISNANTVIDESTATTLLEEDLQKCYENIAPYDSKYHFTTNEYDALVSFCFNIGSIDQLTQWGKRTKNEIANAILLYNKCGDKVVEGLVKRRNLEHNLYVNGVYPNGNVASCNNPVPFTTVSFDTTLGEIVDMVINGEFGNGDARKDKLYDVIQNLVNYRLGVF